MLCHFSEFISGFLQWIFAMDFCAGSKLKSQLEYVLDFLYSL